jgi:hypothetical protein
MDLPWSDKSGKKLFSEPHMDLLKGNNIPDLFEKIRKSGNDRSRIILCTLVLESQTDRLLGYLIKNYDNYLKETNPSFYIKLSLLNSFDLIAEQIFKSIECLRKIRNEFAHNLNIDRFDDLDEKAISRINQTIQHTTYDKENTAHYDTLEKKISAIEFHAVIGLEIYEPNLRLLSEQMNSNEFKDNLTTEYKKRLREQHDILDKYIEEQKKIQ